MSASATTRKKWQPDTHAAYVTNESDDTVSVITPPPAVGIDQTITQNGHSTVTAPPFSTTGPRLLVAFTSSDGGAAPQATTVAARPDLDPGQARQRPARHRRDLGCPHRQPRPRHRHLHPEDRRLRPVADRRGLHRRQRHRGGRLGRQSGGLPGVSLHTTQPGSWVYGVGQDYDDAVARTPGPASPWSASGSIPPTERPSGVQDSALTPAAGTAVTVNDTAPEGSTWDLAAAEILPARS